MVANTGDRSTYEPELSRGAIAGLRALPPLCDEDCNLDLPFPIQSPRSTSLSQSASSTEDTHKLPAAYEAGDEYDDLWHAEFRKPQYKNLISQGKVPLCIISRPEKGGSWTCKIPLRAVDQLGFLARMGARIIDWDLVPILVSHYFTRHYQRISALKG